MTQNFTTVIQNSSLGKFEIEVECNRALTLASPGLQSRTPLSDCRECTMHCSN